MGQWSKARLASIVTTEPPNGVVYVNANPFPTILHRCYNLPRTKPQDKQVATLSSVLQMHKAGCGASEENKLAVPKRDPSGRNPDTQQHTHNKYKFTTATSSDRK
jgi:hypothetical protein